MFAIAPRPNEFIWVTIPHLYNGEMFYQLALIRAESIYFCEDKKEWVVRCGEWEYYLEDCIIPEDQIDVKERLEKE